LGQTLITISILQPEGSLRAHPTEKPLDPRVLTAAEGSSLMQPSWEETSMASPYEKQQAASPLSFGGSWTLSYTLVKQDLQTGQSSYLAYTSQKRKLNGES